MKGLVVRFLFFLSVAINVGVVAAIAWNRYEASAAGPVQAEPLREQLRLTDEQVREFDRLYVDLEATVAAARERIHERRRALFDILGESSPAPADVDAVLADIGLAQAGIQRAVAEYLLAQARVLSPEQRARFVDVLVERTRGDGQQRHLPLLGPEARRGQIGRTVMKKTGIVVVSAAVLAVAWLGWRAMGGVDVSADAAAAIVSRRDLSSSVLATGAIRPQVGAEVKVGSRVSGVLQTLHFNIGDGVRRGDLIAELDDRDLRARVSQAEAGLRAAEARLALIQLGARDQEIAQARSAVADAEATRALAEKQLQRQTALFARELVPQSEVDVAVKNLESATARLEAERERLSLVERRFLPEEVAVAEAQAAEARAAVSVARTQLSYARIAAPIDGVIASVSTQEGEAIAAGFQAPTFVTLVDLNRLQADAFVDETDIGKIAPGQRAVLTVDAFPDRDFTGTVTAILPKAIIQQNVVYYDAVVELDPSDGLLRPDMTASIRILVGERAGVLAVPSAAVMREEAERVVYVLEDGRTSRRVVRIGWRDGGFTEIVSGLAEGERVLIRGGGQS
jgi:HlyD family secretion protein